MNADDATTAGRRFGGLRVLMALRQILALGCGATVIPKQMGLSFADQAFDEMDRLKNPADAELLRGTLRQLIDGLPEDAIVEVPAIINHSGIHGQPVGSLPKGITALLQREVVTSQLCIDSVVKGDRTLALQSLLLDPNVTDLDQAEDVLEQILFNSAYFLPQFFVNEETP